MNTVFLKLLKDCQLVNKRLLRVLDIVSQKKFSSMALLILLTFGGSYYLAQLRGIPQPSVHDEYSYLLAADTFAHGRITNPSLPFQKHFETFHILMEPTYSSKYPPGQGFFMAIGQVVFGHPIYGVWLSAALMGAAFYWALCVILRPRWAFLGALAGVLQFGIFSYWGQSYWGGAVAGLGGALFVGAMVRVLGHQKLIDVMWLGLSVLLLINTRPIEGLLVGLPISFILFSQKLKWKNACSMKFVFKCVLPFMVILVLIGFQVCSYNRAVTKDPFLFPHVLYNNTHTAVPYLITQELGESKSIDSIVMRDFEEKRLKRNFLIKKTWDGFLNSIETDSRINISFFWGFLLALPGLCYMFFKLFNYKGRQLLVSVLFIIVGTNALMTCPSKPHYYASLTLAVTFFVAQGFRLMGWATVRKVKIGMIFICLLILLQLLINLLNVTKPVERSYGKLRNSDGIKFTGKMTRQDIISILNKLGGKHLVIVKYNPKHDFNLEWVYNDADLIKSPIIWARKLTSDSNQELINYFKDRKVWNVNVGRFDVRKPYFEERL